MVLEIIINIKKLFPGKSQKQKLSRESAQQECLTEDMIVIPSEMSGTDKQFGGTGTH